MASRKTPVREEYQKGRTQTQMLDFYIIPDSNRKPESNDLGELDYAGGLEFNVYERLIKKGVIDKRFGFYSDFRWRHTFINQIISEIKADESDSDILKLSTIVNAAKRKDCGLIAYGD